MKIREEVTPIPIHITSDNLIELAQKLKAIIKKYEGFELGSDEDGACILGVREETRDERKNRLSELREERVKNRRRKEEEKRLISAILEKNPGVTYVDQPVLLSASIAEKMSAPGARNGLFWSMLEPAGSFIKHGMVVSWNQLWKGEEN
jgi:hypothetical protein